MSDLDGARTRIASALLSALHALHQTEDGIDTAHHEGICSGLAIALALTEEDHDAEVCVAELQSRGLDMLNEALIEHLAGPMAEALVGEIEELLRRHP